MSKGFVPEIGRRCNVALALLLLALPGVASANDLFLLGDPIPEVLAPHQAHVSQADELDLRMGKTYALGVSRYKLDHETEVLGWQVSSRVYFGRQRGEDSGLTLVWHQANNQVSLSKDGIRLTRRF